MKTSPRHQSGVMLLEVMIGMILFLIGILGVMGLQAVSMKNTVDAKYRTEATYLANQIIGRMWADAANLGSYAIPAGTDCPDPGALANDKERWMNQVCAPPLGLPGADTNPPTIVLTNVTPTSATVTVTINWRKDASENVHNHTVITDISVN